MIAIFPEVTMIIDHPHDEKTDVVEEVDDVFDIAEVSRLVYKETASVDSSGAARASRSYLSVAEQQQAVEHVENARGRLMDGKYHRLVLLLGVVLQRRHQVERRRRVQTGRRFLFGTWSSLNEKGQANIERHTYVEQQ